MYRLENLANRERQIDLTLQRLRKEHASAAVRAERAEDEVARLRDALQTAAGEAKAADRRLAALDADNGSLRREAAGLKQHLRGMEAEAAKLREGLHAAKDEVGDLKNRYRCVRACVRLLGWVQPTGPGPNRSLGSLRCMLFDILRDTLINFVRLCFLQCQSPIFTALCSTPLAQTWTKLPELRECVYYL